MTDSNGTNMNGDETGESSQLPLNMILEITNHSTIERQLYRIFRQNFLEQRPITWKPFKVELVVNPVLTEEFFVVRKKFEKAAAGNRREFEERYAFLIENDTQVHEICHNGYHCAETSFNVLGHSKYGIYVCKYADVCIRHASVRRTWEGNVVIKMIVFKIVEGKQTAALVRKGPKLQPIAPTPQFTSHCSVITPKETDDLEKQFDQSQIFLYEFEGREAIKRPHHCLPFAIISLIQDGSQWPVSFDDSDAELGALETDTLQVIANADDPLLQNKLKENSELAEAATRALSHVYEEEPLPPAPVLESLPSPKANSETIPPSTSPDNTSPPITNGTGQVLSPTDSSDNPVTTSPPTNGISTDNTEVPLSSTAPAPPPPPPPPSSSSSAPTSPTAVTPAAAVATTLPLAHSTAAIQAAYRQTSLLGALPAAAAIRAASGGVYATQGGLANGLAGPVLYGGIPLDALRGYQTATGASPIAFATHAGQTIQQPALYAAQLQALVQQQQAAQLAAVQQQQQQQQNLINSIPAGYALVRTSNGGYALLAQGPSAQQTVMQSTQQLQLAPQQGYTFAAPGQSAATAGKLPVAFGGQQQQIVYQYAGQPTMQAAPTQYIQLPANYGQQQGLSTSPVLQTTNAATQQAYISQSPTHYFGAPQTANTNNSNGTSTNSSSVVSSSSSSQVQPTSTVISPQKQSAASATAAAIQQQQQYQHAYHPQQQQQQQQQQSANTASMNNMYYAAIAQAQAQQQQQLNLMSQMQYVTQQAVPQQMYYASTGGQTIYQAGGQSYVLAQAAPTAGSVTTTGAPVMYSAGPALHNGAAQQHSSQSPQQIAYQITTATGQPAGATYQMINATSNPSLTAQQQQQQSSAGPGVVAQQSAQLVQRSNVLPQVRHHPYRN